MKPDLDTNELSFRESVYQVMKSLPADKITTYGDVASIVGHPYAARVVGGIANSGPSDLPWHRLVNRNGGLARGFPGGPGVQRQLLVQDGFKITDFKVDDFEEYRWTPVR